MKAVYLIILLFISLALQSQDYQINQKAYNHLNPGQDDLYQSIDAAKIIELFDARPDLLTQADNIYGIQIQKNDILLFVTSNLNVGKLHILFFEGQIEMSIHLTLYDTSNAILIAEEYFVLGYNLLYNIDSQSNIVSDSREIDLKWGDTETPTLFPQNNISIFLLNESRNE